MIVIELYGTRNDGVALYRIYSDADKQIRQVGTGHIYSEAIDVDGSPNTYEETDIDVETTAEEVLGIALGDSQLTRGQAKTYRKRIQEAAQSLPEEAAMEVKSLYPTWAELVKLGSVKTDKVGYKFTHEGKLYSCIHANPTFQADWIPGVGTESLYTRHDETHAGTEEDPIPYEGNMALENGKYYSQDGAVYLCVRDTINPVYHALKDLLGLYLIKA